MILYRYCAPKRLADLEAAKLRYCQPHLFNDPFELRPHFAESMSDEVALAVSKQEAEIWGMSEEDRAAVFDFSRNPKVKARSVAIMRQIIFQYSSRTSGFVCLSEHNDSLLMWAHYAQRHEGFVVGFDVDEWNLTQGDAAISPQGHLRQVVYSETRPTAQYLINLSLQDIFFTKGKEWAYEAEWRVGRDLPIGSDKSNALFLKVIAGQPIPPTFYSDVHLFDFPRKSVRTVIMGVRSSKKTKSRIKKILLDHPSYRSVELYTAELDQRSFQLTFSRW